MKRVFYLLMVILLFSVALNAASDTNFTFSIHGTYLTIANDDFKTEYGGKKLYPEGRITANILGNFYLWGSYGFLPVRSTWTEWSNKKYVEPDIAGKRTLDKHIISFGAGYFAGYIEESHFGIRAEAGICGIYHTINTTYTKIETKAVVGTSQSKQSGYGFRGSLGITYGLYKKLFSEVSLGYIYAADSINSVRVNMGGLKVALGLGVGI
ncbi:MAG: hypothetical protein ACM3SY_05335 [Candidatus Omnitrophota bacterium]